MVATNLGDYLDNSHQEKRELKTQLVYSEEEISKHSTEADGWMIVDGQVFNVTQFIVRFTFK